MAQLHYAGGVIVSPQPEVIPRAIFLRAACAAFRETHLCHAARKSKLCNRSCFRATVHEQCHATNDEINSPMDEKCQRMADPWVPFIGGESTFTEAVHGTRGVATM